MGKSNKKIKNDRINAIRKQYDAFLEEDKKRRDRNEYILGQLDKMRSSTALVPISPKANYYNMDINPEIFVRPNNLRNKAVKRDTYVSLLERQNVTSGILNKSADELRILKEISKNYILIPKRTKPIENDYNYRKDVIDDDWKSKYNILDDLKKLEKEDKSDPVINHYSNENHTQNKRLDVSMDINTSEPRTPYLDKDLNKFDTHKPEKDNELTTVYKPKNEFPAEQDNLSKQVNFNVPKFNHQDTNESGIPLQSVSFSTDNDIKVDQIQLVQDNIVQENINTTQQEDNIEKENSESNEKDLIPNKILHNNPQICEMSNIDHPTAYEENVDPSDYNISTVEIKKYTDPEDIKSDVAQAAMCDQTITDVKPHETSTVEETVHLDQNVDIQKDASKIQDLTSTERVELYDDTDNSPEEKIVAKEATFDKPQDSDPAQNTVPVDLENVQHPEHAEHESEINAFEAEQREMFYSEQGHADTYDYNQGEGTGEYAEGYEQNEQYAYYEGVQQDQAYTTGINEHEEATERYDPHYNQQYEGTYDNQQPDNTASYENTNAYEQQQLQSENQQFENVVNYENQQENANVYQQENVNNVNEVQENVLPQDNQVYDQHLYAEHPGVQEHIEQQLATEEGYVESSPVIADTIEKEAEGENEKVMDTPIAEESMLDPKLS